MCGLPMVAGSGTVALLEPKLSDARRYLAVVAVTAVAVVGGTILLVAMSFALSAG
jgi:hypothetical protein